MPKAFASAADLEKQQISFTQLSESTFAYTAEGDPNSGVVVGEDSVLIVDTTATPSSARQLIAHIRTVSDKPIKHVVLSHYHAVRTLGASAFVEEGSQNVISSRGTYELIQERGEADMKSELARFPRLFANAESIPGLTWPNIVFERELTLRLGKLEVRVLHPGAGHTRGDTVVWVPSEKVLFSGDLVEYEVACYCGDAYLGCWPATIDVLRGMGVEKLVPGRGPALKTPHDVAAGLSYTRDFVTALLGAAKEAVTRNLDLRGAMAHTRRLMDPRFSHVFIYEHCLPFDVSRAFDEARGIVHPRIWTADRDQEMWAALQR